MNAVPVVFHQKLEHDCQVLIARAKTLIAQNQYDQAAETLSSILPDISCYPTADQMMRDINDHRCSVALGAATAAWAAKNVNATSNALSSISADSKCSTDANRIAEEVRAYVRQQENREWQFKLLDHNDRVDLTKMTIKAARAVGVAYASRRTKIVYNTTIISRW
jgi:methyl coenzyme M reductase beta subunit